MASKNSDRDEYFKAWRRKNRARLAAKGKARYERLREKICEKQKPYLSEYRRITRAKENGSFVTLTDEEKEYLLSLEISRRKLIEETGIKYEVDHIIPFKYGGLHHPINVRLLEADENRKRDASKDDLLSLVIYHIKLYHDRDGVEKAKSFCSRVSCLVGSETANNLFCKAIGLETANRLIGSERAAPPTAGTLEDLLT